MSLIIGQNRRVTRMAGPDAELEGARELVGELVKKDEARTASRMTAYTTVGRRIGRSGCWVYRLMSGHSDVGLTLKTWRAIVAAYQAHSEALTRQAETARRRAELLQGEAGSVRPAGSDGPR